ncbi:MAG TPA: hypothetical protein VLT33_07060, partial [Labilithrix sp.]|nr:hypothetical protein [Labilithrix sp.]
MLHRSRSLFAVVACAAVTAACAHQAPGPRTGPAADRIARVPASHADVPAPVVRPFAAARDGSAILLAELEGRVVAYV